MNFAARQKALADALRAEDVSSVFQQPNWQNPRQPDDIFTAPERTAGALQALVQGAGQNIEAGMNSPLSNTGAPLAPHAGSHGDQTAMTLVHATLNR